MSRYFSPYRLGLSSASAALVFMLMAPATAQAGFFEQLFGGGQPQAQPSYGSDTSVSPQRDEPFIELHRRHVARKVADDKPVLQKTTDIDHDKTLRAGDAVMTPAGIAIFTGRDAGPHRRSEFTTLDNARHLKQAERVALASIDTTRNDPLTKPMAQDTLASGRSAAMATPIVAGVKFTDQRGRTIRYIGP